jgi:hypothetical protein
MRGALRGSSMITRISWCVSDSSHLSGHSLPFRSPVGLRQVLPLSVATPIINIRSIKMKKRR